MSKYPNKDRWLNDDDVCSFCGQNRWIVSQHLQGKFVGNMCFPCRDKFYILANEFFKDKENGHLRLLRAVFSGGEKEDKNE